MALGIVLTAANLATKALKGSSNGKGNLFKGMKGKFAGVTDGLKEKVGDFLKKENEDDKTKTIETETDMELRGRKDREAEAKRQEEERLKLEAEKKNKTMMYVALGIVAFLMFKKKR